MKNIDDLSDALYVTDCLNIYKQGKSNEIVHCFFYKSIFYISTYSTMICPDLILYITSVFAATFEEYCNNY